MNDEQKEEQAKLLKKGDGAHCYFFAKCVQHVKGADIQALQERVIKFGNARVCWLFARNVSGADIEALQKRVLELGKDWECYGSNEQWIAKTKLKK
ncbi:MAG: hypothetical protein PHO02_05700 [Candidatus Nanoarchaeia archaeon]|nr:hypothetical protein [Candidatus Nanoarchaeia archaeon]